MEKQVLDKEKYHGEKEERPVSAIPRRASQSREINDAVETSPARRSARRPQMTERHRAALSALKPRIFAHRRKTSTVPGLAAKKALFYGVEISASVTPGRAAVNKTPSGKRAHLAATPTFAELAADTDENMEVEQTIT